MLPYLDDFLDHLRSLDYSPETLYNYERDIKAFAQFLTESNPDFLQIDKKTITYYKAYLTSRDRKTLTLAQQGEKQLV